MSQAEFKGVKSYQIRVDSDYGMSKYATLDASILIEMGDGVHEIMEHLRDYLPPGDVIIKCSHCGQWAARKTACHYCGAPV